MFLFTEHRKDIQVLRGLAVLSVILFHAKESFFPGGYLGVDVFFVISGFVVTPYMLRIFNVSGANTIIQNLGTFFKKRFYRLFPALMISLCISAILIFLFGSVSDHQRFAKQGIATLLIAGNVGAIQYQGDYFSPNPNPLIHTWSLAIEEQIYIFLPIFLILVLYKKANSPRYTYLVLGCITITSFALFFFRMLCSLFTL